MYSKHSVHFLVEVLNIYPEKFVSVTEADPGVDEANIQTVKTRPSLRNANRHSRQKSNATASAAPFSVSQPSGVLGDHDSAISKSCRRMLITAPQLRNQTSIPILVSYHQQRQSLRLSGSKILTHTLHFAVSHDSAQQIVPRLMMAEPVTPPWISRASHMYATTAPIVEDSSGKENNVAQCFEQVSSNKRSHR
jgi:hypothetical protein